MSNTPSPSRGIAALPVLAIVLVLALVVVGTVYFATRDQGNTNTVLTANTANTNGANVNTTPANANVNGMANANAAADVNGVTSQEFVDSTSGLRLTYPTYLAARPGYPYDLDTTSEDTVIQTLSMQSILDDAEHAAAGFAGFLDSVSLELLNLSVTASTHAQTYNGLPAYDKSYTATATTRISGTTYTASIRDVVIKSPSSSAFLFVRAYGRHSPDFDAALQGILSSVTATK